MARISLKATEREIFGKKVNKLRKSGIIPGHVFGKSLETEHVSVKAADFIKVYKEAGETGLIDLKISKLAANAVDDDKTRPVLIRQVQLDPVRSEVLNIDFYQVNLKEKTTVNVPIELIGEEPEIVHSGEAVVIQPMMEVEVEALPDDLPENIEVDISSLKAIDDAITVADLPVPTGVTILAEPEAVVVKLDNAVTAEMQELLEEQAEEQAAATEAAAEGAEGEEKPEGEEGAETPEGEEKPAEGQEKEESAE
ncbi:MAG: 50S ribosomal protein L25 [Candidatus Daviesbacteria bacterium]|nr:50S ribosomal protein L25 [Candidatus Daviesbacteria bacterium]